MNYEDMFLIIIMYIVNTIFLWRVLKSKKKLSMNSYTIVSLYNGNDQLVNKLITPLLVFNYLIILSYIIINQFLIIFLTAYMPVIFLYSPIIYVSNNYIGTLVNGKDTESIDFIEINICSGYIEVVLKYKNGLHKKLKYTISIFTKNKYKKIENFISVLKKYGYKVYVKGWKSILI